MKLYEFDTSYEQADPLQVKITAALTKIKADIDDSSFKGQFRVDSLLSILSRYGIRVSEQQLRDAISQEPWSNFIADVEGDHVIFKGDDEGDSEAVDPDETTGTLELMADRAKQNQEKGL